VDLDFPVVYYNKILKQALVRCGIYIDEIKISTGPGYGVASVELSNQTGGQFLNININLTKKANLKVMVKIEKVSYFLLFQFYFL
jgi:hypothetical protein